MNRIVLTGRIAKDLELKTTNNGTAVLSFSIAVNRRFKNSEGKYDADFFNCTAWRQTAEFISKHFLKGSMIAIEGTLQNRSYTAQDNSKRTVTEIMVENAEFCGSSEKSNEKQEQKPAPAQSKNEFVEVDDPELPF